MYQPQTVTEVWAMFGAIAAATGFLCDLAIRGIMKAIDKGRSWIITVPEVPGSLATIERRRVRNAKITDKAGDEGNTRLPNGNAAYPSNRGPIHFLTSYGSNLVAPTKDDPGLDAKTGLDIKTADKGLMYARFRIWDPLTYWRACRENDMEDLYSAQREKDHWAIKLAPVAIILFIGMLAFLGFMLWKLMPLLDKVNA